LRVHINRIVNMKLDFLICGSANDAFYSQIAFFRLCLNNLGGHYSAARLVAVFGNQDEDQLPPRWERHFNGIEVEWVQKPCGSDPNHKLQHERRFDLIREDADFAFMCDADVAIQNQFDSLLAELLIKPALVGVIAHYHFPWGERKRLPEVDWVELSMKILGKEINRPYRYTLYPEGEDHRAPFYINYGLFGGTPDLLKQFFARDRIIQPKIAEIVDGWWAAQISIALTSFDLDLPVRSLPMRYNFPNDAIADNLYPEELKNVVFMHYLRNQHNGQPTFYRHKIFVNEMEFRNFIEGNYEGSNSVFRDFVLNITNGKYPFP